MERFVYAAVGLVVGALTGAVGMFWYLEDVREQEMRTMLILHGDRRAVACQLPEAQRPKHLDCGGLGK